MNQWLGAWLNWVVERRISYPRIRPSYKKRQEQDDEEAGRAAISRRPGFMRKQNNNILSNLLD